MTTAEAHKTNGIKKDLAIYVCLLVLAGLQFVIAYQNIDASQMLRRMLVVAGIEAGMRAGCTVCGITTLHSAVELRAAGAEVVTRSLADWTGDAVHHLFA